MKSCEKVLREYYTKCILFCCFAALRKIFDEDNYAPMSCQDESEYSDLLKEFPFDTEIHGTKVLTHRIIHFTLTLHTYIHVHVHFVQNACTLY